MSRSRGVVAALGGPVLCLALQWGAPIAAESERGVESITADELRRHVGYLAADRLMGRDTGEPGVTVAEEYVEQRFRDAGLRPLPGADGLYWDFSLYRRGYDPEHTGLALHSGERETAASAGVDFRPFDFSDDGECRAPVVFAGYGITAPEHDWDDYEGLDVEGKVVLVLRHEPGEVDPTSSFDGTASTNHALFDSKARNAQKHGAAGMILVTDPLHHDPGDDLRLGGRLTLERAGSDGRGRGRGEPFLAVHASRELLTGMLPDGSPGLEELQRKLDTGTKPADTGLVELQASIRVARRKRAERVSARNVVGFLEGSDPALRDEWIVVGGHHDHVGGFSGPGDTVFNGADDNASGTSGVIELAEAFARRGERPRRSIVFATFSAEEKGLLGSRALLEQEGLPVERLVFMLNLDMIGRNPERPVDVFGDGFSRGLREVVLAANAPVGLHLEFGGAGYSGNSDHDPFYRSDIPFMFLFTGVHEDYHQLGDHPEKLDFQRMEDTVRLAYGVVERLADAPAPPRFVHHVSWLGVQVEAVDGAPTVTDVEAGSRAAEAGFERGDVLTAMDGRKLSRAGEIGERFRGVEPGTTVRLDVRRADAKLELMANRAHTGYMGVAPGPLEDEVRRRHGLAETEGFVLTRITEGGPSDGAGLRAGDIVFRIAGRPVGLGSLRNRLQQIGAGETVALGVIRDGQRMTLDLVLGERPR